MKLTILLCFVALICGAAAKQGCVEPADPPPPAVVTRYRFDSRINYCDEFKTTVVSTNLNRYETKGKCLETCLSTPEKAGCVEPADPIPPAIVNRYRYDPKTHTCDQFRTTVASKNLNRYETKQNCLDTCYTARKGCSEARDPGKFCQMVFSFPYYRVWYNPDNKNCENFLYLGCEGNANNYRTKQACKDSCMMS